MQQQFYSNDIRMSENLIMKLFYLISVILISFFNENKMDIDM